MKRESKKNLQSSKNEFEEEDHKLSPIEEIEQSEYLSDITDKIDLLVEKAETSEKKERKVLLKQAQDLMDAYEVYTGRSIFNKLL